MDSLGRGRGVAIILAGYAVGAAWLWLNPVQPHAAPPPELIARVFIAFLLPTAAAVLLWTLQAVESRPLVSREPAEYAAIERIIFRCILFIGALHALVVLRLGEAPWIQARGGQLTFVLVGALLVGVGNLLPTTRPNVLVGVRTPRSLRSRQFWMEINRAGGYLSVALGAVVIAAAVVLRYPLAGQVISAAVLAAFAILVGRYLRLVRVQ